jgi:hypothetical protein
VTGTDGKFKRLSQAGIAKPVQVDMTMTPERAASVNLPGRYAWPRWTPAPTPAVTQVQMPNGGVVDLAIMPVELSQETEAAVLAVELGGSYSERKPSPPFAVNYHDDPRRVWMVQVDGTEHNAGTLLAQKYANGVGAPGAWSKSDGPGNLHWDILPQIEQPLDAKEQWTPVPVRPLDENEGLEQVFGGVWQVVNYLKRPSPPATTADLGAVLSGINTLLTLVKRLLGAFSISTAA